MKHLAHIRPSTWWLFAGLCVSYPMALWLPTSWGWENGPLEDLQALCLLGGLLVSLGAAYQQRHLPQSKLWWVVATLWLGMLGRELAWGAAFLPPIEMQADKGPLISSRVLWWKPAVVWVCAALLVLSAYLMLRYRLLQTVVARWAREHAIPWGCLVLFVAAMLLSAWTETQAGWPRQTLPEHVCMVMEEMAECWAYLAVWWGQWRLVRHMQAW